MDCRQLLIGYSPVPINTIHNSQSFPEDLNGLFQFITRLGKKILHEQERRKGTSHKKIIRRVVHRVIHDRSLVTVRGCIYFRRDVVKLARVNEVHRWAGGLIRREFVEPDLTLNQDTDRERAAFIRLNFLH